MKHFNNMRMTIFDSTNACLRVQIEATFTRKNPDGSLADLVYVTNPTATSMGGNGNFNPNMYITFTRKGDSFSNNKTVYTSYSHLFKLRSILSTIKDWLVDNSGFAEVDGKLVVKPECTEPMLIQNIGKNSRWISFSLVVIETGNNGITERAPGVKIEISEAEGQASLLTADEATALYAVIDTLDLPSIAMTLSMGYLAGGSVSSQNFNSNNYNGNNNFGHNNGYNNFNGNPNGYNNYGRYPNRSNPQAQPQNYYRQAPTYGQQQPQMPATEAFRSTTPSYRYTPSQQQPRAAIPQEQPTTSTSAGMTPGMMGAPMYDTVPENKPATDFKKTPDRSFPTDEDAPIIGLDFDDESAFEDEIDKIFNGDN